MIAERTGLAPRLLRYVVYHGVLPGLERVGAGGQGATRSYTPFEAFGIAVSAMLLDAGLKRGVVQDSLAILCRKLPRGPVAVSAIPLLGAMHSGGTVGIEVAEARYVRLRMEGGTAPPYYGCRQAVDSFKDAPAGWKTLNAPPRRRNPLDARVFGLAHRRPRGVRAR